ncbi:GspH/FimT family pseudopilin [Agarivorans albus]|uniref:Type II secretion system protein H n=1 Tax=Agarivorans albus MKT 106 TaxID=1331007 RepID=R9PMF0_AGAAL|nr:GspH/FimT family pseudopilin [Agarivorans albus]GAD02490.1 type IV fimbrial biogenesis protein FimT [Agarivorans albus MKT 106]
MLGISKQGYVAKGFTLLELMIAVAILVIVMVVAVPSLQGFMQDNKQKVTRDLLANSLLVAQQEAIRNNLSTYVCPTSSGTTCANAWGANKGWLVYLDTARNGALTAESQIIASYPSPKSAQIKYTNSSSAGRTTAQFFPTGHALAGTLKVCASSNDYEHQEITISRMGRVTYAVASTCL